MNTAPYLTINQSAVAEINIERSRFIGHCLEVETEEAAKAFINQIRAQHAQANHNCFAYHIGSGEHPLEYFNDHGEPSGTAGKPILGAIQRLNLINTVVVVTRYFGGKKLGVRGLIEAYGQAATTVLEQAGSVLRIPKFTFSLTYGYADHSLVLYRMNQIDAEVLDSQYTANVTTTFAIPETNRPLFEQLRTELPVLLAEE
ncbi:MAG TPA: YigZ family protein [Bacillota bacterium]|nr:YigZ family protein [Bacillota bacterium]